MEIHLYEMPCVAELKYSCSYENPQPTEAIGHSGRYGIDSPRLLG